MSQLRESAVGVAKIHVLSKQEIIWKNIEICALVLQFNIYSFHVDL